MEVVTTHRASKPAPWEFQPWLRYSLVFLSSMQILFMLLYWAVYVIYLIAGITFAPGRGLELTNYGALLTAFVVVSIGTTGYEAVLLSFSDGKQATTLWLLVRMVLSGVWTVLPIIYLVWLMRNPYIVPFTLEIIGMAAACLAFLFTLVWNAMSLYRISISRTETSRNFTEAAPLLYADDNDVDEFN